MTRRKAERPTPSPRAQIRFCPDCGKEFDRAPMNVPRYAVTMVESRHETLRGCVQFLQESLNSAMDRIKELEKRLDDVQGYGM